MGPIQRGGVVQDISVFIRRKRTLHTSTVCYRDKNPFDMRFMSWSRIIDALGVMSLSHSASKTDSV